MLDSGPIEQWIIGAHATPNSWAATYTPPPERGRRVDQRIGPRSPSTKREPQPP